MDLRGFYKVNIKRVDTAVLECQHMNKEQLRAGMLEQIRRPIYDESMGSVAEYRKRYAPEELRREEMKRLSAVRGELAELRVVPIINVIVPGKREEGAKVPPPETLGEAALDLIFGFFGLVFRGAGAFLESLGEKK